MIVRCATTNRGKLREFGLIVEHFGQGRLHVEPVPGLATIPAPDETGATFAENAAIKAAAYSLHTEEYVFADDSGLTVDALGGAPGIYSARYAGPGATDLQNNEKVLAAMAGQSNRAAHFVCAIAVACRGEIVAEFSGDVPGKLLDAPRGPNGFGYDPLFFFPPFGRSFGEASAEEKLLVSHRGRAMEAMIAWLLLHAR